MNQENVLKLTVQTRLHAPCLSLSFSVVTSRKKASKSRRNIQIFVHLIAGSPVGINSLATLSERVIFYKHCYKKKKKNVQKEENGRGFDCRISRLLSNSKNGVDARYIVRAIDNYRSIKYSIVTSNNDRTSSRRSRMLVIRLVCKRLIAYFSCRALPKDETNR